MLFEPKLSHKAGHDVKKTPECSLIPAFKRHTCHTQHLITSSSSFAFVYTFLDLFPCFPLTLAPFPAFPDTCCQTSFSPPHSCLHFGSLEEVVDASHRTFLSQRLSLFISLSLTHQCLPVFFPITFTREVSLPVSD